MWFLTVVLDNVNKQYACVFFSDLSEFGWKETPDSTGQVFVNTFLQVAPASTTMHHPNKSTLVSRMARCVNSHSPKTVTLSLTLVICSLTQPEYVMCCSHQNMPGCWVLVTTKHSTSMIRTREEVLEVSWPMLGVWH